MANDLTGEYEAVAEISVPALNGLVATLHQNGGSQDASPSFLHGFWIKVGDEPELDVSRLRRELMPWISGHRALPESDLRDRFVEFGDDVENAMHGGEGNGESLVEAIAPILPPGVAERLTDVLDDIPQIDLTPRAVRGLAQVQVGTPSIRLEPGSTSEIDGRIELRANYVPDPDTAPLPQTVHGTVRIRFEVRVSEMPGFDTDVIEVAFPSDDAGIEFEPAPESGLSTSDADRIEAQLRKALRERFEPTNMQLPAGFPFNRFKAVAAPGAGDAEALALPLQLSDTPTPPPSALDGVNRNFLEPGSGGFGVAVGRDYILSRIQPQLDALRSSRPTFTIAARGLFGTLRATYTTTFTAASASWVGGRIRIRVAGGAATPAWWAPNVGSFAIQQDLALAFDATTQSLTVAHAGEPDITVSVNGPFGGLIRARATQAVRDAFNRERDRAISQANAAIRQALGDAGNVDEAIKSIDAGTSARFTEMTTESEGLVLFGEITTRRRPEPVVRVIETADEKAYSALHSWIPGGTIERFEWTWSEWKAGGLLGPGRWRTRTATDEHSFILPKPDRAISQVCLRVVGTQVGGGQPPGFGVVRAVRSESSCAAVAPELVLVMPGSWARIHDVLWRPDPPPDGVLNDAIRAHVDIDTGRPGERGANTVVHFADLSVNRPLDPLGAALAGLELRDVPLAVAVVLPRGSFDKRRDEFERKLGEAGGFDGALTVTEDYRSGWSQTFGVENPPATYLTNARGELVWAHKGRLDADALTEAIKAHAVPAPPPRPKPFGLSVRVGERAPDVLMETIAGERLALRKLRGQPVTLLFWQSWSAPCVRELLRLQRPDAGSVVLAINSGESREELEEFLCRHDLDVANVTDPRRLIAGRYGVGCWPTTVSIDREGRIETIKLGVGDEAEAPEPTKVSDTAD